MGAWPSSIPEADSGLGREISLIHEEPAASEAGSLRGSACCSGGGTVYSQPSLLDHRQQGGPISILEAACVQAQRPELYRLRLIQSS